jgi:hypothetical protein
MPQEITWGDPLPICGYLRVSEELRIKYPGFNFVLERQDRSLDQYRGNGSEELGDPEMDKLSPAYGLLKEHGELYFTVNGQHPYRDLSPGDYQVEIRYLGQFFTGKKPLKVIAGGWRKELSDALVTSVCEGNILADLSEYFSLVHLASLADDRMGQGDMDRRQDAAWRKGYVGYQRAISDKYRPELESLGSTDRSIPLHVYKESRVRCPGRSVEVVTLLSLFAGIKDHLGDGPGAPR